MTKNMMCQYQLDVLRQRALMACCKAHEGGFQRLRNPDLGEVADALFHLGGFRLTCGYGLIGGLVESVLQAKNLLPRLWKPARAPITDNVLSYLQLVCKSPNPAGMFYGKV